MVGDGSKQRKQEFDVDFVVLTRSGAKLSMPDTNLVIFGATISGWHEPLSLADYNTLNDGIQQRCFISAETGDERYSYGQPYFVSRTDFATPKYSFEAVEPAIRALGLSDVATSYAAGGKMSVLRCTVMNPYLDLLTRRSPSREPFVGLMEHLYRSAVETWAEMQSAKRAKISEAGGE